MKLAFKKNMSTGDRLVRIIVGAMLLGLGPLTNTITPDLLSNTLLGVCGVLAVLSALISYCFLYDIAGIRTLKSENKAAQ